MPTQRMREPLPRLRAPTAESVGEQQARDESPGDVDRHRGTHDPELEVPHQQPGRRDVYREPYGRGRRRDPVLKLGLQELVERQEDGRGEVLREHVHADQARLER